jgi:hypothetical protein
MSWSGNSSFADLITEHYDQLEGFRPHCRGTIGGVAASHRRILATDRHEATIVW